MWLADCAQESTGSDWAVASIFIVLIVAIAVVSIVKKGT